MRTMHLFAGAGGGLLADLILGHTPVVAVEWDRYACQVLRERAAEGWFPELHVWEGDVRLFDPSEYAGKVDCIHAGFPCQDISLSGKQAGVSEGTRSGLYREVLRIADAVRPQYLFLENVAAILSNGLGTVLGDLAARGYDTRWMCLRASDVGAPHYRDRWWLLANTGYTGVRERGKFGNVDGDVRFAGRVHGDGAPCRQEQEGKILAFPNGAQRKGNGGTLGGDAEYANACPPAWWAIEPGVGRVADGVPNRAHRLKGTGNGQVPLQAAIAWKLLGGE